ncbi:MAG: gliding motility-associated C-terminal domain-containing protein, partial [Flavobacteriales bacterium]
GYSLSYLDGGNPIGPSAITSTVGGTYVIASLNAGGYSNITIAFGGCSSVPASGSLSDPSSPVFAVSLLTNPNTCGGTQGSIHIEGTGTLSPSTLYSLSYTDNGLEVGPANITSDANGDFDITGLDAGSYTAFVLNLAGCIGSQSGPVTLLDPALPLATAGTTTPVLCEGSVINLIGNTIGGATYSWIGPNLFTSNDEDPVIAAATATESGTYTLTITLNNCVSLPSTVDVTVNATPVLIITDPVPVCSPATVSIIVPAITSGSANAGTLTYWSDAAATSSLATPSSITATGTYYIQANNNGCIAIAPVAVTVVITPDVVTNNPAAVCSSLTVDLTVAAVTAGSSNLGVLTYWVDAAGTLALTTPAAVTTSGTYYIQSGISGCTDIEPVVVTVNQTPNLVITNPTAVCTPATVDLTAAAVTVGSTNTGTLTYWTDGTATISLGTPGAVTTGGTYYIQANNAGCTDLNSVIVTVNQTPNLVITNPVAVCTPATVDLTVAAVTTGSTNTGTLTYWTDGAATIAMGAPGSVASGGTYYIQANNAGCADLNPVVVTVNQTPNLVITNPTAVCTPATVDLTAAAVTLGSTNTGTLTYWTDGTATISLGTPGAVTTGGTYYIQANNAGCAVISEVSVIVNATPSFTLTVANPSLCDLSDGSITISGLTPSVNYSVGYSDDGSAIAAATYTSSAGGIISIAGLNAGNYNNFSVTIVPSGCTGTSSTAITLINPGAPVVTDLSDQTVCDTYTLPAINITGPTTAQGYYTATNGGGTQLAVGSAVISTQMIYIYAVNGACSDEESVFITVNNTPVLSVNDPAAVCSPLAVDITVAAVTTGSSNLGVMTYWSDASATTALSTPSSINTTGSYYIQSANGSCIDIQPVNVVVNQTPVLTITNPTAVCYPEMVDITATSITSGSTNSSNLTYWNDFSAMSSITIPSSISTSGTYYIQADNSGCTDIEPVTVVVNTIPSAPIAGSDSSYCSNWNLANMTASGTGGTYTWYTDPSLTAGSFFGTGSTISPQAMNGTVTYYVTETLNGCEGSASTVTITIEDCDIIVPTAFTPNGDGEHDVWEIIDLDNVYPKNAVTIYNRWGNVVFKSEEGNYSAKPWDGTYEGNPLPVSSYYFIIDFNENDVEPKTGTVTIIINNL